MVSRSIWLQTKHLLFYKQIVHPFNCMCKSGMICESKLLIIVIFSEWRVEVEKRMNVFTTMHCRILPQTSQSTATEITLASIASIDLTLSVDTRSKGNEKQKELKKFISRSTETEENLLLDEIVAFPNFSTRHSQTMLTLLLLHKLIVIFMMVRIQLRLLTKVLLMIKQLKTN